MDFERLGSSDAVLITPKVFSDERGYFFESFNEPLFASNNIPTTFVQDNQSLSKKDVLRGLHFQVDPWAQGKLVRVVKGSVRDVIVDIRKASPTYGQHFKVELSEINKLSLWVPPGFAHGFASLEENTLFCYKCTQLYNKESERCILWNDPDLNIDWGIERPILNEKDLEGKLFNDL